MYDSKKQARVAKPLSKAPQQQRNLSGVMRGSSGTHGMRSDSRSNGPAGKPYDTTIGFQGLDQAKVNCKMRGDPDSAFVVNSRSQRRPSQ